MNKHIKENIDQVFIKWIVGGRQMLLINLSKSGAISRAGDGEEENKDRFFIGRTQDGMFQAFMEEITENLFEMTGRYELPNPQGEISTLTIAFTGNNLDTGFEFTYGTESDGPPEELVDLVDLALEITHPWWEEELSKRKQNKKRK